MQMDINNPTAVALAALATEQARKQEQATRSQGDVARWYIWQRLRGSDHHAIEVFKRWDIPTYYPMIMQLRAVPRRHMSAAQRKSGMTVQKPQEVALFPGYLFTQIDLSRPDWHRASEVAGVGGLICKGNWPVYMPDDIIASIRKRENNGAIASKDSVRVVFGVGEAVMVTNGPFASFPAIVENGLDVPIADLVPEMRISVAVNIFGRQTPVELEYWQVAKQDQ